MKHLKIIVGHVKPEYDISDEFVILSHADESKIKLFEYNDLKKIGSNILSEYYWLFSLKRTLCSIGEIPNKITIAQYRRFVISDHNIGSKFTNLLYSKYLTTEEISGLDLNKLMLPKIGESLINTPFILEPYDIMLDYARNHIVRDLLRFLSDSIDSNLLEPKFIIPMIYSKSIIPAPTIGTFKFEDFLKIMDILENLVFNYINRGYVARGGYQSRVIGFLLERVNSAMLLNLHKDNPTLYEIGSHIVHSNTSEYLTNPR